MAFRHYTQCYAHTAGDKPFNKKDLVSYSLGVSAPGLIVMIASFLTGGYAVGFAAFIIQYAVTLQAIAKEWLEHRLICLSGNQCAVGVIDLVPTDSEFGDFDNDKYFDIRLMPHRYEDAYRGPNCAYATLGSTPWQLQTPPKAGPSLDGLTESMHHENDTFLDNFQGTLLMQPSLALQDLAYDPVALEDTTLKNPPQPNELTRFTQPCGAGQPDPKPVAGQIPAFTRATLHCEAEGNFWAAIHKTAGLQALAAGAGGVAGAAAGAAAGCEIGGIFGPIGCAIGAFLGFIGGLAAGAAGGAYVAAQAAFSSDPGDVNDANVGDTPLGTLNDGDQVIVYGTHVYDGFHEGWHEIHPLMAIMRAPPSQTWKNIPGLNTEVPTFIPPYIEWAPDWAVGKNGDLTSGLTATDMQQGLASPAFRAVAEKVKGQWCGLVTSAFSPGTRDNQIKPANRWTIHPLVDGCEGSDTAPPLR